MPTFVMKVIELVVTTVCVGLVTDMWYVAMTPAKTVVVNGTFVGYIMLSTVIILGFVLDTPLDRKLVQVVTLPGAVMFFCIGLNNDGGLEQFRLSGGQTAGFWDPDLLERLHLLSGLCA